MAAILNLYDWQQEVFAACADPEIEQIACLGSRGPGKTWTAQHVNIVRALEYPNSKHIIFRRTSDDIVKQYAPKLKEYLNNFGTNGHRIPHNYNSTYKVFTVTGPGGGTSNIFLGFAEVEKHADKHMSAEYMTATFDESTHFEEIIPRRIAGSVRGYRNTKKIYMGNPGGVGHSWNKKRFIDPRTRDPKTLVLRPQLKDNIELAKNDPGYKGRLTQDIGGDAVLAARWLEGDWDIIEGAYFTIPPGCIRFRQVPAWATWWAGVDWGYWPSAFACVYVATWRDPMTGNHHAHVFADLKKHRLTDPEQAEAALDVEATLPGDRVRARFADPSTKKVLAGENDEQTKTTLRTWAKHKFVCLPAHRHGRVPGWQLLRQFLRPIPGYSPDPEQPHGVLTISPNCYSLISELQEATHEDDGDDMKGADHALDSLRYLLTMVYNMRFPQAAIDALTPRPPLLTA